MPLAIAAIRTGHDPVGKLPDAAFHTQLDRQLICPKCDVTYNLLVDYAASTSRFFAAESAPLIRKLEKAVFLGHGDGHRVVHFETNGVAVTTPGLVESTPKRHALLEQRPVSRMVH